MSNLTLRYLRSAEDDFGRLHASVETSDFSGRGSAYAQWQDVDAFARNLSAYPLREDEPPILRCGFNDGHRDNLLILVEVTPSDNRGTLRVRVEIADPVEPTRRVRTHFTSHYPQLADFQNALLQVIRSDVHEAVLRGD